MHTLHSLPFHIDYDGEAQVSKGFSVIADEQDSSKFTASFRGRRLTGTTVALPSDLQSKPILVHTLQCLSLVVCRFERDGDSISVSDTFTSDQIEIYEWNKEDVPEKSKLSFASFSRFLSLQVKVN